MPDEQIGRLGNFLDILICLIKQITRMISSLTFHPANGVSMVLRVRIGIIVEEESTDIHLKKSYTLIKNN